MAIVQFERKAIRITVFLRQWETTRRNCGLFSVVPPVITPRELLIITAQRSVV
eukprot:NODE_2901_length_848_cov_24.419274_g2401_i0.p2 GENE.NODE_2901_length_848_cov_24.419274_g2401_i0~~NODE_2901_length_848_cov_24.419274_g2401_i0.p2  ORF type:complete len:53 (+),score=2.72 NODE_2901_length_848_cov_24.419274_g2401_i0:345-503(+)